MSENPLPPGFMVIHSNQAELLRQVVVQWMKASPLEPLEDEIILVQSNGIAQWLKQALAADESVELGGGCGIAASLQLSLPSRFTWQAYRAVIGQRAVPDTSPFDKSRLLWRLMRLLPQIENDSGYEPLARFLNQDSDLRKRYQLAERLADLFDQYQVYRADWLAAWAEGKNVILDHHGQATDLTDERIWQPMLWRALAADVGVDCNSSRADVHQRFLDITATLEQRPVELPRRVMVFGLSLLPKQSLEVLWAISRWTQVILCVNNPCEYYWANLLTEKDLRRRKVGRHSRKPGLPESLDAAMLHVHAHPLLAAWGKQGGDYIALLDEMDAPDQYQQRLSDMGQRIDLFESHGEACLLNQLQDDIRDLRPVAETLAKWPAIDPRYERSLRFHIAHSPQREVEVLQDQLLAAFNADTSLKPREIIVMVPDINRYAPHIQAVFSQIHPLDDRFIPYAIADLGQRHQAPLVFALEYLLGIAEARLSVSEVLDLLNVAALRKRFGIQEADLPLLQQWIKGANIRWGLNEQHRHSLGITFDYGQNSWLFGLKRLLLGYAMGNDPVGRNDHDWHDIEPYGDIGGLDAALVGPLTKLLTQIETILLTFAEPAPPGEWVERLQKLLLDFFEPSDTSESYLLLQLQASLEQWRAACEEAALNAPLSLNVVREFWLSQINQGGLSQRFLAGSLTFATLMPMRAIPFRRIYLLGMNDGDYPRLQPVMDFDLMARNYRPGDRSRREDDRYLFLEALLSAREHLHVSWVGRSIQDNTQRPPSVLVSQLRDHIAAGWKLATSERQQTLLEALTVEHPLQAFSHAYFTGSQSSPLFTYAREWQTSFNPAMLAESIPAATLAPPVFDTPLTFTQLSAFLKDPVKSFFRERLRIGYEFTDMTAEDQEPFALDPLKQWFMQDELIQVRLDARRQAEDEAQAVQRQLERIRRQGLLPTGHLTALMQTELAAPLEPLFEAYEQACRQWSIAVEDEAVQVEYSLNGNSLTFQCQLTQVFMDSNQTRCRIEISSSNLIKNNRYRIDKLIPAWIQHLAGHLNGQPMTTCLIGKNGQVMIQPLTADEARQHLMTLIEAYVTGLSHPLPFALKTALSWQHQQGDVCQGPLDQCSSPALEHARKSYEGSYNMTGEVTDNPYLQRVYPHFDALWSNGEFTVWARQLLSPLIKQTGKPDKNSRGNGGQA